MQSCAVRRGADARQRDFKAYRMRLPRRIEYARRQTAFRKPPKLRYKTAGRIIQVPPCRRCAALLCRIALQFREREILRWFSLCSSVTLYSVIFDNLCIRRYIIQVRRKKNLRALPMRFLTGNMQFAFGRSGANGANPLKVRTFCEAGVPESEGILLQ